MITLPMITTFLLSCNLLIPVVFPHDLTFGGGGLKSIAVGTALSSSLLSLSSQKKRTKRTEEDETLKSRHDKTMVRPGGNVFTASYSEPKTTLSSSGIMDGINTMVGISGGAWFLGNLIYSEKFVVMVEDIASSITSSSSSSSSPSLSSSSPPISDIYNDAYSQKFIDAASSITGEGLPLARNISSIFQRIGINQDLVLFIDFMAAVYEKGDDPGFAAWQDVVEYVLMDDIPPNATFSYTPQTWAEGKSFAVGVMVATPVDDGETVENYMWYDTENFGLKEQYVRYTVAFKNSSSSSSSLVNDKYSFFPVRFSHILGDGSTNPNVTAPFPYNIAPTFDSYVIEYDGKECKASETCSSIVSKSFAGTFDSSLAPPQQLSSFGNTPIIGPLSATSADVGLRSGRIHLMLADQLNFDGRVTFAPTLTASESFNYPRDLFADIWTNSSLGPTQFDEIATLGMHSLVDGGGGDYDGIGAMIATGASEFMVVSNTDRDGWMCHFRNANCDDPAADDVVYQYPLFGEDINEAERQKNDFSKLTIAEDAEFLFDVRYGTVTATTVQSDLFGIDEGQVVTFRILIVTGNISTFGMDDFNNYGYYCQEIAETLTSEKNKDVLSDIYDYLTATKT